MKKIMYTLLLIVTMMNVNAQSTDAKKEMSEDRRGMNDARRGRGMNQDRMGNGMNGDRRAMIEIFKTKFITEKLALTPSESEAFWPVYRAHEKNIHDILKDKKDNELALQEAILNTKKKMAADLKPILKTDERINAALKVDREFLRRMRSEMMRRKGIHYDQH